MVKTFTITLTARQVRAIQRAFTFAHGMADTYYTFGFNPDHPNFNDGLPDIEEALQDAALDVAMALPTLAADDDPDTVYEV